MNGPVMFVIIEFYYTDKLSYNDHSYNKIMDMKKVGYNERIKTNLDGNIQGYNEQIYIVLQSSLKPSLTECSYLE